MYEQGVMNRIGQGTGPGALPRMLAELVKSREFAQMMGQVEAPYKYQLPTAQTNVVSPTPVVSGGGPSEFSKIMDIASVVGPMIMGMPPMPTGGGGTGLYTQPGGLTPGTASASASDWLSMPMF